MRTYYIVEHRADDNSPLWQAHKSGFWTLFGVYNLFNFVSNTITWEKFGGSASETEKLLRVKLDAGNFKCKVIRVVKI